jgi:hypothetical protein
MLDSTFVLAKFLNTQNEMAVIECDTFSSNHISASGINDELEHVQMLPK